MRIWVNGLEGAAIERFTKAWLSAFQNHQEPIFTTPFQKLTKNLLEIIFLVFRVSLWELLDGAIFLLEVSENHAKYDTEKFE